MLVLSRRPDTAIQIGGDIRVTVLAIKKRQVKLGIDAPRGVAIWRREVLAAPRRENVGGNHAMTDARRNPK